MTKQQSLRQWVRELKKSNPTTDSELMEMVKKRTNVLSRTGIMSLQNMVIDEISDKKNTFKTLLELFNVINKVVPQVVEKQTRAKAMFGVLRKAAKLRFPDTAEGQTEEYVKTVKAMRLPKTYYDGVRETASRALKHNNTDKKTYDGDKLIQIINNARLGDHIDNIIVLQAASGSRIGEITEASSFKKSPNKPQYIIQTGILKTDEMRSVVKPLLYISVAEFLKRFKDMKASNDRTQLHPRVNKRLKKWFGEGTTSHHLRKIYADLSYRLYADPSKISQSYYVGQIMGHDPRDPTTANSYTVVNVKIDDIQRVKILEPPPEPAAPIIGDIPRNLKVRDGKVSQRLAATIAALNAAGIPYTARSLGGYGYGARVVRAYMKDHKKV